jgi:hypothetical protein
MIIDISNHLEQSPTLKLLQHRINDDYTLWCNYFFFEGNKHSFYVLSDLMISNGGFGFVLIEPFAGLTTGFFLDSSKIDTPLKYGTSINKEVLYQLHTIFTFAEMDGINPILSFGGRNEYENLSKINVEINNHLFLASIPSNIELLKEYTISEENLDKFRKEFIVPFYASYISIIANNTIYTIRYLV